MAKSLRLNEQIRISPIRVINQHQEQLGVIPTHEAMALAREAGLDLVEVSPTERPPVCRIMDYGKHQYERKKRLKHASAGHVIQLKELRIRPKTDVHDLQIKLRRAREFLQEGHKVQFTMLFKGRERFNREFAQEVFGQITSELAEVVRVERPPAMDGRRMTMIVTPGKPGAKTPAPPAAPPTTGPRVLRSIGTGKPPRMIPDRASSGPAENPSGSGAPRPGTAGPGRGESPNPSSNSAPVEGERHAARAPSIPPELAVGGSPEAKE